jgi:hypothetical protein
MAEEKQLTHQESLDLITEMLQNAKGHFHTSGTSAILWGSVVGFAGITSFLQGMLHFSIGFDVWLVVLIAIIPQFVISARESRNRRVLTYEETWLNAVWMVYGFSMFALLIYMQVVPGQSVKILKEVGKTLLIKNDTTNAIEEYKPFVFSASSLYLILYSIPTLITGIASRFKPMIIGGILCYIFFILSLFTPSVYDVLMNGLAGIFSWLIPGLILRRRCLKAKVANV